MFRVTVLILTVVIQYNYAAKGETESTLCLNSTDFAVVVNCKTFVDKTLLIKTLLEGPPLIAITAPRCSGKSTSVNMIKRFFEMIVDEYGEPDEFQTTYNYKLFVNNKLKISKHKSILKEHFGKYPVLFVDYSPLRYVTSFKDIQGAVKAILSKTYGEHKYILESRKVHAKEKQYYDKIVKGVVTNTDKFQLNTGLHRLASAIYACFGKKQVVVLIDNYDAYADNLIFITRGEEVDAIIRDVTDFNNKLLNDSRLVSRAVVTGELGLITDYYKETEKLGNLKYFHWLRNYDLSTYYSLTESDVDELLARQIPNAEERQKSKNFLKSHYNGYTISPHNTTAFSWSVVKYYQNVSNVLSLKSAYLKRFIPVLKLPDITKDLQLLLQGKAIQSDTSARLLTTTDVMSLKNMFNCTSLTKARKDLFYFFLHEHGYLTTNPEKQLIIPNIENKLLFEEIMKEIGKKNK